MMAAEMKKNTRIEVGHAVGGEGQYQVAEVLVEHIGGRGGCIPLE